MKILERMRLQAQINNLPTSTTTPDPKLQKELQETKKQLNSILTNWKFGDQPLKSAPEFLKKFTSWIDNQLKEQKELKDFLKNKGVESLEELSKEVPEDYEALTKENQQLKKQLESYKKGDDWETTTGKIITDLEKEVKDLTTERDTAIREQKTSEQEALSLTNRLKNKSKEADSKETALQQLKEKSASEIALNKTITELRSDLKDYKKEVQELREKHKKREKLLDEEQTDNNKLTKQIEQLEERIKELTKS